MSRLSEKDEAIADLLEEMAAAIKRGQSLDRHDNKVSVGPISFGEAVHVSVAASVEGDDQLLEAANECFQRRWHDL